MDFVNMELRLEEITPAKAQELLGFNPSDNRTMKTAKLLAFADDIRNGRWSLNGETIKFAGPPWAPKRLIDGQHRLLAIVKAGQTVRTAVAYNVPEEAVKTVDTGTSRSTNDALKMTHDFKNISNLVSIARMAIRRERGMALTYTSAPFSAQLIEEWIVNNPTVHISAEIGSRYAKKSEVPASIVGYTHFLFSAIDLDEATAFWRDAAEKIGLSYGDPALAVANKFADERRQKRRIQPQESVAMIVSAWNKRRRGETIVRANLKGGSTAIIPGVI